MQPLSHGQHTREDVFKCEDVTPDNGYDTRYAVSAHDVLRRLVDTVFDDEDKDTRVSRKLKGLEEKEKDFMGMQIVLACNVKVLRALLKGNIAKSYAANAELREEMDNIAYAAMVLDLPSIYMHVLVDKHGAGPTPLEIALICHSLHAYLKKGSNAAEQEEWDTFANKVDNRRSNGQYSIEDSRDGIRKYLAPSAAKPRDPPGEEAVEAAEGLLEGMLRYAAGPNPREPAPLPYTEVGYSAKTKGRLAAYHKHQSSTRLMNLIEAICETIFEDPALHDAANSQLKRLGADANYPTLRRFGMKQFVIHIVTLEEMAITGEIFFTRLTGSYSWLKGLNYFPAGLSNNSSWNVALENGTRFGPGPKNIPR